MPAEPAPAGQAVAAFTPLALVASTACSAMGLGRQAMRQALAQRRSGLRPTGPGDQPAAWIGRVDAADDQRLPPALARFDCRNNRLAELALAQDGFAEAVAALRARLGPARIAVVMGTSTSGIAETEAAYARRAAGQAALPTDFDYAHTHDLYALARFVRARLGLAGPALTLSTACTSGARAFLEAAVLLRAGLCDAAVVGGVDTLCRMTLQGFSALALLAPGRTRPGAADRDGITLGEAGAFALLLPAATAPDMTAGAPLLLGGGASSDGHHMSTPHPEGLGALAAMRAALDSAGLAPEAIGYVNLHGTGTRANDAMEDQAVARLFGRAVPCSSTKGWTGHTLGAAGALEAVLATLCLETGLLPGALGVETPDPAFQADLAVAERPLARPRVMSNSFGFGGSNCSLIFGRGMGA